MNIKTIQKDDKLSKNINNSQMNRSNENKLVIQSTSITQKPQVITNKKMNNISLLDNNPYLIKSKLVNNENSSICDIDIDNKTTYSKTQINTEKDLDDFSSILFDFKDENSLQKIDSKKNTIQNNIKKRKEKYSIKDIRNSNLVRFDFFDTIFKCGINMKYNSNKLYNFIKNKMNIPIYDEYKVREFRIFNKDNSFYRCLSLFLYARYDDYDRLRKGVTVYCKNNINNINNIINKVEIEEGNYMNTRDYINTMENNTVFITDIELMISSLIFGINIATYRYINDRNNMEFINSFIYEENNLDNPSMILINDNINHYNLIFPKKETKRNNIKDNNQSNNNNSNDPNNFLFRYNISHEKIHRYRDTNPFPIYSRGNDENLYYNIFNFINNGIVNGKRTWPDYIEYTKDYKLKASRKIYFYRKIGLSKDEKINNNKDNNNDEITVNTESVESNDKYYIENGRLFMSRYEYNNTEEKKIIYKKYMIPYKTEVDDIIKKYHNENHQGLDETIESIKNNNYYWISIYFDVNKYLKNCDICNNKAMEKSINENLILK